MMSEKKLMLKFLESWCELELFKFGKIHPLCYNIPFEYELSDNWQVFWEQIEEENIYSAADNCRSQNETTLVRMLLIHDFVNWLYE